MSRSMKRSHVLMSAMKWSFEWRSEKMCPNEIPKSTFLCSFLLWVPCRVDRPWSDINLDSTLADMRKPRASLYVTNFLISKSENLFTEWRS